MKSLFRFTTRKTETENDTDIENASSTSSLSHPPDGGLMAWTQVLCMHFVFFNSWGLTNSFSVFEQLYTSTLPQSTSQISWIGSVQVYLLFFCGVFTGRATDAGYFRSMFTLGVIVQLVGMFMLSVCKNYWQIFLAQAVCFGLGNGLTFIPAMTVMSSYFSENRTFAVGLAAAGSATGGLVYPAVIDKLLDSAGFGWAVRATGFIMLVTHIPGLLFLKSRLPPRTSGPLIEWAAFTEPPFVFFTMGWFLNFWGLYFVFFYLGTFAKDKLKTEDTLSFILVLNGVGVIGRTLPGLIGDKITGKLNILVPFSLAAGIMTYCWAAVETQAGLYVFIVFYGLAGGALQALFPAAATIMAPDLKNLGTRFGMIFSIVGIATLTGPVIDGALIQNDQGDYLYAQIFAGTTILLGAFSIMAARVAKTGFRWKVKV